MKKRLINNIKIYIRKIIEYIYFRFLWHRLKIKVAPSSIEYQNYLETQLNRTIKKRDQILPNRAKILIDKTAEFTALKQSDILCIGCRNTSEIDYFRQKGAKSVIGIDLFSESPDVMVMDMHQLTFEDNSFDLVYSSHSLEHSYNHKKVIHEIVRVLRPHGTVVVEVPVRFEARGADLIDFDNPNNLYAAFEPFVAKVVWSKETGLTENETGTDTISAIISISKS